jgi:hypothetical protein
MRGYLQRLVESRDVQGRGAAAPPRPALSSRSPVAQADQRLNVDSTIADAVSAFIPEAGAAELAQPPLGESRTIPSYRTQGPPRSPQPVRPVSAVQSTVPRYAMPLPPSPPAAAPPAVAAPHPAAAAPGNAVSQLIKQPEQARAIPLPQKPAPARGPAAATPARDQDIQPPAPLAIPIPPALDAAATPERRAPNYLSLETSLASVMPGAPQHTDAPQAPVEPHAPNPQPSPRDRMTASEIRLPPQREVREIELTDREPAHSPSRQQQQRVIVRETIRTPAETPQKPQPMPQKLPRTAAEASVIGPLPRQELARSRLDIWLR